MLLGKQLLFEEDESRVEANIYIYIFLFGYFCLRRCREGGGVEERARFSVEGKVCSCGRVRYTVIQIRG